MDMKKTIALLLCLCLTTGLLAGCGGGIGKYEGEEPSEETSAPTEEPAEDEAEEPAEDETEEPAEDEAEASPAPTLAPGLGAAAYDPDTVAAVINGEDVTWKEYYYWLNYYVEYTDYLAAMGLFSYTDGWNGNDVSPDYTDAQVVCLSAADNMTQYRAMETLAEQMDITLDEEGEAQVRDAFEQDADSMGDGDGQCTDDEAAAFEDYLAEQSLDRPLYERMVRSGVLLSAVFDKLYGEGGEKYSDADTVAYCQEQGLMQAKHILLMTIDSATGEALPEEEAQAKKDKADKLYAQLAEVADDPQALEELFDQLMEEHTEDGGVDAYPDGYLFGEGVMVTAFEETVKALEEYGLSEPVASDYGWHIILRLPLDPDGTAMTADGQAVPVRAQAANAALMTQLNETAQAAQVEWKDGFETPDMELIFGQR